MSKEAASLLQIPTTITGDVLRTGKGAGKKVSGRAKTVWGLFALAVIAVIILLCIGYCLNGGVYDAQGAAYVILLFAIVPLLVAILLTRPPKIGHAGDETVI